MLFTNSFGDKYILVADEYVSRCVEAQALAMNDIREVVKFLKNLFSRLCIPMEIISDSRAHFCNEKLVKVLKHLGVTHKMSTPYHPQTSGQVEVVNGELIIAILGLGGT